MKPHHHSARRPFQPSAFRLSGFLPQPSAFRLSGFFLAAFSLQTFSLFCALSAQTITTTTLSNQFRTSVPGSDTIYILAQTGSSYQTPGSWEFSGTTFSNSGPDTITEAAVYVDGGPGSVQGSAVFTGSNLEILATGTSGNSRRALMSYRGANVTLVSSTIRQTETNAATGLSGALYIASSAKFYGSDLLIEASGPQVSAIVINNAIRNAAVIENSVIQNSGSAAAIYMGGSGAVVLTSCTVNTTGAAAPGFMALGAIPRFSLTDGLIYTTGASSPALWFGTGSNGNGAMQLTATFTRALLRAENGMGLEINTNLPGLTNRPSVASAGPSWAGYFDLTLVSSTLSGALGAVRMTSSSTSGASGAYVAEIPTSLRITLGDSALEGDVLVNDGAQLILNATASRLSGALRLSGSAPVADVALDNFTLTGGIVLSGGAALNLSANTTTITGTLSASGNAAAKVLLTGSSTIDAVAFSGSSTLELTMDNTSRILGDFTFTGGATYTLLPADNRALTFPNALTLAARGNLRVAPGTQLTLTAPLTLSDPTAIVTLADARGDDLVLAAGLVGKGRLDVQGVHAEAVGQPEMRVIHDATGSLAPDAFTLAAPASSRLFAYRALENRPDGAYLTGGGFSPAGAAILDSPALAAADFFDALTPAFRHLASLRESTSPTENQKLKTENSSGDAGSFWLTARAATTSAAGAAPGLSFRQQTFALAAGADLRWGGNRGKSAFTAGISADTGFASRDFDKDASGNATTFGATLYGLYRHAAGWHLAATARAEAAKNDFDTRDAGAALSADYTIRSAGLAVEFGWRLPGFSPAGWWCEPSVGAGFASIGGATYDTRSTNPDNCFHVAQNAATATQSRAQIAFGRDLGKKWSLRATFAASYLDISGGKLSTTTDDATTGADVTGIRLHQLGGFRVEAACGIVYRLGTASRLWLDCDTALATNYKRPWTLSLGFAKAW